MPRILPVVRKRVAVSAQSFEPMPQIAAITGIAESAGIEKQAQQLSLRNVSWALGRLGRGWD